MATAANPLSPEEYLLQDYSPDCEYIDGVVTERNVGEGKHSYTQMEVGAALREALRPRPYFVLPEQRTRVSEYRVRVPDISVLSKVEEVTTEPPRLCVEILSPDDRWVRVNSAILDYHEMGVPCVRVFECDKAPREVQDGFLAAPHLDLTVKLEDVLRPKELR